MTAFAWGNDRISLSFEAADDGPIRLVDIIATSTPTDPPSRPGAQRLVEILTPGATT